MFEAVPHFSVLSPAWLAALIILPLLVVVAVKTRVSLGFWQATTSLCVRCLLFTLLVLALAGLTLHVAGRQVFVVFAVDTSLSLDAAGAATAADYVTTATSDHPSNRYAIMEFAGRAVDSSPQQLVANSTGADVGAMEPSDHRETNLQLAIESAMRRIPAGAIPHVVLLTDGNATEGDALQSVMSTGAMVSTVPLPVRRDPEISVASIAVPAVVPAGQPFEGTVIVDSNHPDSVLLEIFSGEFRIASREVKISAGENRFPFTDQVDSVTQYTATIRAAPSTNAAAGNAAFLDSIAENNTAAALVHAAGEPRVLIVDRFPAEVASLVWALKEEGIRVDVRPPEGIPDTLSELNEYQAVAISNVPATLLTNRQMEAIRRFVSDSGGGFIMLGGQDSFGLGGYYRTAIEDILPVRCDFEKEQEKPGLAMILVIDRSGSMGGQKIALAKEAALGALDLLSPRDQIGVIAFEGSPYWISEIRPLTEKALVAERIATIKADGGTSLYPALQQAFNALQTTAAKLKHVIVLTDGYSEPGDFEPLVAEMAAARITVTTVGIGDADRELLEGLATIGRGRYYFTDDPGAIPQIFARETVAASQSGIQEEPFLAQVMRASSVLSGIDFETSPFLLGYVVTRPKPTGELILSTDKGDPLLAWWRHGLGMTVAFTSDAGSRWASEWAAWPGFNRFWVQVVRNCMRREAAADVSIQILRQGSQARITVDAIDAQGRFLVTGDLQLSTLDPQMKEATLRMLQVAPGRYEAAVPVKTRGMWNFQVTRRQHGTIDLQRTQGMVVGYSEEFRQLPVNESLLQQIAAVSGGTYAIAPEDTFTLPSDRHVIRPISLQSWLVQGAMLLLVLDVALRRLQVFRNR